MRTRKILVALVALAVLGLSFGIASAVTYVTSWGSEGSGPGQFNDPYGVAVDAHRHVYVTDGDRIQKFTSDGAFRRSWGSGDGGGLAVDPRGHVYAADYGRNRI